MKNNIKRSVLLLMIVFSSISLAAQFNDSTFYMLRYSATGIINRTNDASSYAINNGLRFSITKKTVTLNSSSSWVYGEQQRQLTNNDFSTALDANWYRSGKEFYYWGLGTYESSYSLKVNKRSQAGVGVAYKLVDRPEFFINLSDGILYEFANLKVNDTANDIYSTFRNSFRFRLRYIYKDRITLENISFLQSSLQQNDDYIINTTTNISIKLVKWISFTGALKYNKVTRNNRENLLVTFGVTAEKYF